MSDTQFEPGVLDLTGADTSTFDAIPSGRYNASIWEASWVATKGGPEAKLPAGSPMLKLQFKLDDEYADNEYTDSEGKTQKIGKNRRVFWQLPLAPKGYDADKAAKMKGTYVNALEALGFEIKVLTSGKFNLDLEDLKGRECVVVVTNYEYPPNSSERQNGVSGLKPAGSATSMATADAGALV